MVRSQVTALLVSFASTSAAGQEYRGTILGRVLDQQGAVLPGATVVVTNENTNVSDRTVTESDGAYIVPLLIPGQYRVEAELQPPLRGHSPALEADARCLYFKNMTFGDRRLECRLEAFNVTNINIFDTPSTDVQGANFGRIPTPRRSIYFPRNVQLGLKFYF